MKSYLNHFFSLNCAPDILPFFTNNHRNAAKEVTESFAMWRAAVDILKLDPKGNTTVIVIGDGTRPRTAAVFSHLTQWDCVSVDPLMDLNWFTEYEKQREKIGCPLVRLVPYRRKAMDFEVDCETARCLLVLPHSHASLTEALTSPINYSQLDVIAMPCCKNIEQKYLEKKFALEHNLFTYVDTNVWSPKNTVHIWRDM